MRSSHRKRFHLSVALLASIVPFLTGLVFCNVGQVRGFVEGSFISQPQKHATKPLQKHARTFTSTDIAQKLSFQRRQSTSIVLKATREDEIRRKIAQLKRQGKIKSQPAVPQDDETPKVPSVAEQYGDKLRQKLGSKKARLLGTYGQNDQYEGDPLVAELDSDEDEQMIASSVSRQPQLGALPTESEQEEDGEAQSTYSSPSSSTTKTEYKNFDASLFDEDDDDEDELSEEELLEFVAAKLAEKREREQKEKEARVRDEARKRIEELEKERKSLQEQQQQLSSSPSSSEKTTTGIGGRWLRSNDTSVEEYKPSKSGTWGVFERPKDISRAYGGGKRVGAGYTPDNISRQQSEEETRARLRQYREKVGIEVQSEKDHAEEIQQALAIGRAAMERGIYSTAVSALEKVTKWCSTNSAVGGKVFLELAMAYEAVGRTQEAILVYTTLTKSRMEDIKYNAKRLLYGIEAMQFMQNEARNPEFSRKKIRSTFIDTTGLANIAQNFDDVYNTAYIDLDRGFYKRLTESVIRSNREARQVLLKASGAGEVERLKVVQALRSISRHFDDALEEEIQSKKPAKEPVAVIDGKPIVVSPAQKEKDDLQRMMGGMDEFSLASPEQMMENLNGEWRLQLLADKRGDGVKYYNTSYSWQKIDTESMTFTSSGAAGFITVAQSGGIEFQDKRRILTRTDLSVSGTGGMLSGFLAKSSGGAAGAVSTPHQIVLVDSVLLITRMAPLKKKKFDDSQKEYFAVWRRIEPGTSSTSSSSLL